MNADVEARAAIRRTLSWIMVGALCVAALTAIVAVLGGEFDENDARVIGTSVGFAVFSATAAVGASLRLRASESLRTLGLATVVCSAVAFLLLMVAVWAEDSLGGDPWSWWGAATLAAFASSHASLMAGSFRDGDSGAVRMLGLSSIALATLDSGIGILAIAGAFDDVDESAGQLLAVLVILMLLTTALTPVVRRLQASGAGGAGVAGGAARPGGAASAGGAAAPGEAGAAGGAAPASGSASALLASEVIAAADRIQALTADPGDRSPEIRREAERLRELARLHSR